MKKIYYPNCSELLADFNIHDPKVFYPLIKDLGERYQWQFDPPLSLRLLENMSMTKYSYPSLKQLLKQKDIIVGYCKHCQKPYSEELNRDLIKSLKKRLVLAALM